MAPWSPEVYLAQRDSQRQALLSGTLLASPDEEGAPYDVLMIERAKVAAIETVLIIRKQEDVIGPQRDAAVPHRQCSSEMVGRSCQCHEFAVDEYSGAEAANPIARNRNDGLEQVDGSRKVAPVGREHCDLRREPSEGNISNSRGGAGDPIQPSGDTG